MPSATSITPMSRRKASASILTLGWRSTKPLTAPAEPSITSMASTMAVTMMESRLAMPTAVITESSEKTMSRRRIWISTHRKAARPSRAPGWA